MISKRSSVHGEWSSRWVFILAATGSAVGLGSGFRGGVGGSTVARQSYYSTNKSSHQQDQQDFLNLALMV